MRNKCLFALGVVFAMSLTSIVAFAFSFTGEPEAKNDLRQIIAVASVAESKEPSTFSCGYKAVYEPYPRKSSRGV